nr:MAG TPA: hypothetical protein [Caudoviricetes sp.]
MDAVEFINEKYRMCELLNYECRKCKIDALEHGRKGCWGAIREHPEEAVAIVERWAKEHPRKTRQNEFLKLFPRVEKAADGMVAFCPESMDSAFVCSIKERDHCDPECGECRKKYWLEEEKE